MEKKEIISPKLAICVIIMFMMGGAILGGGPREAERDAWLAVLIGAAVAIPAFFVYARLIRLFPEKDLSEMLTACFGKLLGNLVYLLYVLYAFYLGALVVRRFAEFVQISVLPETPKYVFTIIMILVAVYMTKAGIEVLGRWSTFVLPIIISIIVLTALLAFGKAEPKYLQPAFQLPFPKLMKASYEQFAFPYGECALFLMLFDTLKEGKKPYKIYYTSLGIFTAVFLIVVLRNLIVMGIANLKYAAFSSYDAVSIIEIGEFITRIEVIVSVVFLLCGLVKIVVCLMAASKGAAKLLGIQNNRHIIAPLAFVMLFLSLIAYKDAMEMFVFIPLYPFLVFPFSVALPLLTWIAAEIRHRIIKKRSSANAEEASP